MVIYNTQQGLYLVPLASRETKHPEACYKGTPFGDYSARRPANIGAAHDQGIH